MKEAECWPHQLIVYCDVTLLHTISHGKNLQSFRSETMKPHVLKNIQIDFQWPEIANAVREDLGSGKPYLGEIEPQAAGNNDPLIAKLLDVGQECGLTFKKQSWYTGRSYLPIRGSVPWHNEKKLQFFQAKNVSFYFMHILSQHGCFP
jgi:hypothetical protein